MVQSSLSGDYHMSWFTNSDTHQGIYYGRYSFSNRKSEDVIQIDGNAGAGHPTLAEFDQTLYLVWKTFDGQQSLIQQIISVDDGRSWSQPQTLVSTIQGSDYPLIVKHEKGLFLSWLSEEKGYIFKKITSGRQSTESGE